MDKFNLNDLRIINYLNLYRNLSAPKLIELALEKKEGVLASTGALVVNTGKYNGRSPNDRYIVETESVKPHINWGKINIPISEKIFDSLYQKMLGYMQNKDLFVSDGFVGADKKNGFSIRIVNELASQALASSQLFIKPTENELLNFNPNLNIICLPHLYAVKELDMINSECFVIIHFDRKLILIGGTQYFGEIKKSVFSALNYLLPFKNIFPMHCSANTDDKGNTAIFFGLSGTGKTTLSADIERRLIGDDEHGWSDNGVFNFEGGCYAKLINLKEENEPQIYNALKFGSLLENVVVDENTHIPNYDDGSLTENTRGAYPVSFIPNADLSGIGAHPQKVIFLTADAFGVLPPISRLTAEQAMFHFVSGYTSKLAGTERGITEPQATFSTCFGAPFMLLHPQKYAEMLKERIQKHSSVVYLLNTGWTGGPYGIGSRLKISYTRRMVKAILNSEFDKIKFETEPFFGLSIPTNLGDLPKEIFNPVNTWKDKDSYRKYAENLKNKFDDNIKKMNVKF